MDNSSRNIVKFIGTITFAALLIMAARYYAQSQEEPMPAVAEEAAEAETTSAATEDPLADTEEDGSEKSETDPDNPDEELVEEEAELVMGEPSMNLETGGDATIYLPETPPPAEAQVQQ